jgi:hypothetical protein
VGYREQQKRRLNKQQSVDGAFAQPKKQKEQFLALRAVFSGLQGTRRGLGAVVSRERAEEQGGDEAKGKTVTREQRGSKRAEEVVLTGEEGSGRQGRG